jgi:hypothetical protein
MTESSGRVSGAGSVHPARVRRRASPGQSPGRSACHRVRPHPFPLSVYRNERAVPTPTITPYLAPDDLAPRLCARGARNGPIEPGVDEVERLLEVRLAPHKIRARDNRPRLWAVIDQAVMHRLVGSTEVMHEQLRHMADAAQ